MKSADYTLRRDPAVRAEVEEIVGFQYTGQVTVRPVLAVLYEDYGVDAIAARVQRPLTGLNVVPYYGCLLVRPPEEAELIALRPGTWETPI